MSRKSVCLFPKIPDLEPIPDFNQLISVLEEKEIISERVSADSDIFYPGKLFPTYFEIGLEYLEENRWNTFVTIGLEKFNDNELGFTFYAPGVNNPTVPGTDIEVENWSSLIQEWYTDRSFKFFVSQTGLHYFPYELEFKNDFGVGNHFIRIDNFQFPPKQTLLDILTNSSTIDYKYCVEYI